MEDFNMVLMNYFKRETSDGHSEFRLSASKRDDGFHLLIHPLGKDGQTIDLSLTEQQSTWVSLNCK